MKFSIDRAPLLAALNNIQAIVQRKSTIPILTNMLLVARDGSLEITATDLDMRGSVTVECAVSAPGSTTVNADKLFEIARALSDGADLEFDATGVRAVLKSGRSRFQLPQLPPADFPTMDVGAPDASFVLTAGELSRLLTVGGMCISEDDARPYLKCAYLCTATTDAGAMLRIVSTNGHWLAFCELAAPDGASEISAMLMPRTVAIVQSLLKAANPAADVEVGLSQGKISLAIDDTRLTSKLLDQSQPFPPYERLIPATFEGEITADVDIISGALQRASVMALDTSAGRRVLMDAADGGLQFKARNADQGEAEDDIEIELSGEPLSAAYVGPRLSEIFGQVRTENVLLQHNGPKNALVVRETGATDWLALIMPQVV